MLLYVYFGARHSLVNYVTLFCFVFMFANCDRYNGSAFQTRRESIVRQFSTANASDPKGQTYSCSLVQDFSGQYG